MYLEEENNQEDRTAKEIEDELKNKTNSETKELKSQLLEKPGSDNDKLEDKIEQAKNIKDEVIEHKQEKIKEKTEVKWGVAIIVIATMMIIILFASTIFALVNLGSNNIVDGIKIKGVELVGLNKEDAKLEIEEAIRNELDKNVMLRYEDYETSISPKQIEATYNIDKAIEEAYGIGRSGNIIKNNYDIILSMIFGKEIDIEFSYNDSSLTEMINDISKKIPGAVKESSYYIDGNKLIITTGKAGIKVKAEEMKEKIIEQIKNPVKNFLEIEVQNADAEPINVDEIYQAIKKEPKDAYYTENPFTIHPAEDGVDFAISLEEARKLVQENKEEYEIELKYIAPAIPTSQIGTEAFPDLLTTFSTRYEPGNVNRTTNLRLSSEKINRIVLLPGEEFSYNKVVGERTIAKGYKEAAIYSGGEVVNGLGGGICQISSTLYNVAVQANLEITDRSNHQFVTSYIGAGKDATVVYGYIDFKFKNSRNYPIKIESKVAGGIAEMKIYGVKEENECDIKIETEILSTIPYSVKYVDDSSLDAGVEVVKQNGAVGYKTVAYKVCRLNGTVVSKTVLSNDTYSAMTKIIRRGTKNAQAQAVKTTSPQQTKEEITSSSNEKQVDNSVTVTNVTP